MTLKSLSKRVLALLVGAGAAYAVHWGYGEWRYQALLADRALRAGDRDISVKPERACPDPADTVAFVIFGQSNAANHGATRLSAPSDVFDFYEGRCFSGDDPQYSATSNSGSPWPAFAEALQKNGEVRPLLWANVAVGNTRADEWVRGTPNAARLLVETRALTTKGYRIGAFLFFQGEADRATAKEAYRTSLDDIATMITEASPGAPLILSNTSVCGVETPPVAALTVVRASLAASHNHVHVGPDTDALRSTFRLADGCHLSESGQKAVGKMWAQSVKRLLPPAP